mmetsp:Transcript_2904/g.6648  ORF Transcript_2904/g.6648 Transcript_2904/m.6648 type:complete len:229 (-) Transcript_2904:414-1100(-)
MRLRISLSVSTVLRICFAGSSVSVVLYPRACPPSGATRQSCWIRTIPTRSRRPDSARTRCSARKRPRVSAKMTALVDEARGRWWSWAMLVPSRVAAADGSAAHVRPGPVPQHCNFCRVWASTSRMQTRMQTTARASPMAKSWCRASLAPSILRVFDPPPEKVVSLLFSVLHLQIHFVLSADRRQMAQRQCSTATATAAPEPGKDGHPVPPSGKLAASGHRLCSSWKPR